MSFGGWSVVVVVLLLPALVAAVVVWWAEGVDRQRGVRADAFGWEGRGA